MFNWYPVWHRNALVWRTMAIPSLLGNFGEPFLYLLALGYGLGGFVGDVNGMSYATFLAAGIVCASAMNTASFECMYSAFTRMKVQLTWDAMLATPLGLADILIGEIVWAGTKALISSAAILVVAALMGLVDGWTALLVLPIVFLMGCCFGAMALVVTSLAPGYDFFLYYFTLVVTPMFLLSGTFFPLDGVATWVQIGASLLPLTHGVALVRPLMTGTEINDLWLHLAVPLAYGVICTVISLRLMQRRLLV